jgi:phosphotriesterase-related protein
LGPTLAHEHVIADLSIHSGNPDNVLADVQTMIDEMAHLRAAGGRSIVEATAAGVGRDPGALRAVAEASGVQIVAGIGLYDESVVRHWVLEADADGIADFFVREIETGTDGVHAGVIGEIASHNAPLADAGAYRLTEVETATFTGAARAARLTGVAIITHACVGRGGHAQLDGLEKAGADLSRVAIGHCDTHWHEDAERDMAYYLPILERGAFCAFDLVGWEEFAPDEVRADRIAALVELGYEEQILLSTDTCRQSQLRAAGGRGYDYLWNSFLPRLRARGISDGRIGSMLVTAPRRLLAGE